MVPGRQNHLSNQSASEDAQSPPADMNDTLSELIAILPPPAAPEENHGDWNAVEKELGVQLPDDYKVFIETYGTGVISCELSILNPFTQHDGSNLFRKLEWLREMDREFNSENPRGGTPPFPAEGGVLPCAWSNENDFVFWRTSGPANQWGTVIDKRQELRYFDFPGVTFTEFLLLLVKRKLREYRILLINPPYVKKNVPYEYCTVADVIEKTKPRR